MTTRPIIQEAVDRLDWASTQIADFKERVDRLLATYEIVQTHHPHPDDSEQVIIEYTAKFPGEVDIQVRLAASDAVNNLRATVDALMCSLGNAFGANPRLDLRFRDDPKEFYKYVVQGKVQLLPNDIQDWLESIQPYRQTSGTPSQLECLNKLWNESKHRAPQLLGAVRCGAGVGWGGAPVPGVTFLSFPTKEPLQPGSPVGAAILPKGQVTHFKPIFYWGLLFKEISQNATAFLPAAEQHIRDDVVPRFARHFA